MATFLNGLQPTRKTTIQTGFMAIILNRLLDKEVKDRGLSLVSNLVFRLRLRTSANNWICRKLENNTEDRKKKKMDRNPSEKKADENVNGSKDLSSDKFTHFSTGCFHQIVYIK